MGTFRIVSQTALADDASRNTRADQNEDWISFSFSSKLIIRLGNNSFNSLQKISVLQFFRLYYLHHRISNKVMHSAVPVTTRHHRRILLCHTSTSCLPQLILYSGGEGAQGGGGTGRYLLFTIRSFVNEFREIVPNRKHFSLFYHFCEMLKVITMPFTLQQLI